MYKIVLALVGFIFLIPLPAYARGPIYLRCVGSVTASFPDEKVENAENVAIGVAIVDNKVRLSGDTIANLLFPRYEFPVCNGHDADAQELIKFSAVNDYDCHLAFAPNDYPVKETYSGIYNQLLNSLSLLRDRMNYVTNELVHVEGTFSCKPVKIK